MCTSAVDTVPDSRSFSRFFTEEWELAIPSRTSFRLIRGTPSHFEAWIPIIIDSENNKFQDDHAKVWDEAAIDEKKRDIRRQHAEANSKFHNLHVLIELNGQIVGYGDIHILEEGRASIGIVVDNSVQRQGIGKLTVSALAQVCFDCGLQPTLGTMNVNLPMRSLMAGLGVPEVEKIIEIPGYGVVAELEFEFEREIWKRFEIKVEFLDAAGKQ